MIVTFCGHSDYRSSKDDEQSILSILEREVGDAPAELFLGGYGSFDAFARECAEKYRKAHPNVRIVFVTPYLRPEYCKSRLACVKNAYDGVVYPELERVPERFAILKRNRWMVDKADVVIAYIARSFGGAYQTYAYAKKNKKTVYNIAGRDL